MGIWSALAGNVFLDWLAPPPGLRWIDIGCGNGAFTELLVGRCEPVEVQGIDPAEGQLAYARTRPAARLAEFRIGDAMALPFPDARFDAAVMALVVVFVPQPAIGIGEMARVVRPGGIVATYVWDMLGGGFPLDPILVEMQGMGLAHPRPPQIQASPTAALRQLWDGAGLQEVSTGEITVSRTFGDFDEFWRIYERSPSLASILNGLSAQDTQTLKGRVRSRLPVGPHGRITYEARANAIKGRRPA
ncbi:MAG TPA: class I SAM-dependent methyltransferase [Hyphomicrobiaceae bacterium]|nr:class I SAM-dependent methyltransferase [Hyphomicrobiaceae bacterium]